MKVCLNKELVKMVVVDEYEMILLPPPELSGPLKKNIYIYIYILIYIYIFINYIL